MPFVLMLLLTLVCLPDLRDWPAPSLLVRTPLGSAVAAWLGTLAAALGAYLIARRVRYAFAADPNHREAILNWYGNRRFAHLLAQFVVFGASLYVLGWGWAVASFWSSPTGRSATGAELILLSPFLVGLLLSWMCFYDADRSAHVAAQRLFAERIGSHPAPPATQPRHPEDEPFWSRGAYVSFHARQNLALVFLPVLLMIAQKEIRRVWPAGAENELGVLFLGLGMALGLFLLMPWVLRFMLRLRPLPPGRIRDRLEATARRLHFRCNDLLVWHTRGGVANAMIVGVLPWLRYVVFTDRLLADLSRDEVEAVLGHEIGHVKHHHMLLYLSFLVISMLVLGTALDVWMPEVSEWFQAETLSHLHAASVVGLLAAYVFVVFGFLSRRCERQADVYGCRAVSCRRPDCVGHAAEEALTAGGRNLCPTGIRVFIAALEKVAFVNGISRDRPGFLQSWQHSTIARRVAFLRRMARDPRIEPAFQRRVLLVKLALFVVLGVTLFLLVQRHPLVLM